MIIATSDPSSDEDSVNPETNLETERTKLAAERDEFQFCQIASSIGHSHALVNLKPILQIRTPNLTFIQRLTFHGTVRTAELIDFAGGHTESDSVLYLPQEGIVFIGDLLSIDFHPYLGGGDLG